MTEVGKLNETDIDRFYQLYLASFNYKSSEKRRLAFDIRYRNAHVYGMKSNDRLVGGLWSLPFQANFYNSVIPMEGIGVVMTAKDQQGQGIAKDLMEHALVEMYQRKTALSYLAPFSYPFYRKFGYEQVFACTTYTMDVKKIPHLSAPNTSDDIRNMNFRDAIPDLKYYYENIIPQDKGGLVRPDWWWDYLGVRYSDLNALVLYIDSLPACYVVYQINDQKLTIVEWENNPKNPEAFISLLSHMLNRFRGVNVATYVRMSSHYLGGIFADPSLIKTSVKPYMMARIVDLEEFIKLYPFKHPFDVTLNLNDPVIKENVGGWHISFDGTKTVVEKTSDVFVDNSDLDISIQQLSKLMMGGTQYKYSVRVGKIKHNTEKAYDFVEALQRDEPEIVDYF